MNKDPINNRWAAILPALTALTALFVIAAAVLTMLTGAPPRVAAAGEQIPAVMERIPLEAQNALRGEPAAFDALARSMAQAAALHAGGGGPEAAAAWRKIVDAAAAVGAARGAVTTVRAVNQEVHELSPKLLSQLGDLASAVDAQKLDGMTRYLQRFESTAQRMQQDLSGLATGISDAAPAAQRLADGSAFLNQVVRGLSGEESGMAMPRITGAEAEGRLKALVQSNQRFSEAIRKATGVADALSRAQAAAEGLPAATASLRAATVAAPAGAEGGGDAMKRWVYLALLLAIAALAALAWVHRKAFSTRRLIERRVQENERNQDAIMRLLNELSSLADGDLTVQATVTEDITGAIADSINYAIEALRELVTTINDSAIQLDGAMRQTQTVAAGMARASGAQAKQITAASQSMADMAASIEEVSGNSERCADVARHSVDIAHKGGDAVRRTIDGMNAIRETIQETSKRIKRLGESSQEIGNTVELINDIAEQTNILALNASIQASMAGEAGRGFAVVADEVQRLAERAANATKQIEVLVRTIQTDTNEAVVSMERTTTDVVGGALLAENAGAALEEIEQVSNQIANLVQNISASARQQAVASGDISKNMQVVREISSQTAEGSAATSSSIGKLAALAAQLRKSVAGFRLPDYGKGAPATGTTSTGGTSARVPVLQETAQTATVNVESTAKIRKLSGVGA
ncbi:MAG: methyl-accepting chemotaxis protein [Steroidobacterales bacterium]